jgi:phosphatidylglycerol:prolipoprotein diacylglycerol transferase
MHPYINLLGISLPFYNLMVGLSLIIGILVFEKTEKIFNKDNQFIKINKEIILAINIIGGFFFAAFFENLYHNSFNKIGEFGITFFGGIIFSIIINFIIFRFSISNFLFFTNLLIPSILIAHSIGRIGCLMAGCCYGEKSNSMFSIIYPNGESRIAIQLIESFILLIGFYIVSSKVKFKDRYIFYFLYYSFFRFLLEFYRNDDRGFTFFKMSPSQIISIVLFTFTLLYTLSLKKIKLYHQSNT